jgi:hypothetical protein
MTVEPTCPNCKSREHFKLMKWPVLNEDEAGTIIGSFVYCGKCGTAINWIPSEKQ